MRIISAIVAAATLLIVIGTLTAHASDTTDTEINIKTKFSFLDNLIGRNIAEAAQGDVPAEEPAPVVEQAPIQIDERTEGILAIWKEKQSDRWANLPKEKFTINASAYTAAADECGKSDGVTASGVKVQEKRTIACPSNFPFGAKLEIEGYGTYVCEDRGGAIKGNKIDIYVETKTEAFQFGRRNLVAQVVN